MTRKTRRTIFYVLVALFFLVGAAVVLYADGWRIDLMTFHTEKVGGIFVRSFPDSASITLNGKPVQNQSNFLSHGTLISNLFPTTYHLGLSAAGYHPWQENVEVLPSLVTTMKYAVLVPQQGIAVATTTNITNFFAIGDDHVDQHSDGTITWRNLTIGKGTIVSHSTDLKTMIFNDPAGDFMVYDFTAPTQKPFSLTAIIKKGNPSLGTPSSAVIDPYNDTSALVTTKSRVWMIDLGTQTATAVANASPEDSIAPTIASSQSLLAWSTFATASGASHIAVYDKFAGVFIDDSLALPGTTESLQWIDGDTLGILENDGTLYFYTLSTRQSRTIANDVKSFYPTPDGTMLAALENHSLEVFDFSTGDYYRFNLPQMGNVQSLAWYKDQTHLFADYPDHVSFLDLMDTSVANFTTVSEGTASMYDVQRNSLYITNPQGNLVRFDFPS